MPKENLKFANMILLNLLLVSVLNLVNPSTEMRHDFYVGITEIRYAEASETYQITIQLFTHDLEAGILKSSGDTLRLKTRFELPNANTLIFSYIKDKFSIKADGRILKLNFIGRETLSDDETFIYLESSKIKPQDALLVKNSLLMEIFKSQTQIINVVQNGKTRSTTLSGNNPSEIISL